MPVANYKIAIMPKEYIVGQTKEKLFPDSNEIQRALKNYQIDVVNELYKAVMLQVDKVNTTGLSKSSLGMEMTKEGGRVTGALSIVAAIGTGRKPGRMPPVDALKRWARLKLGDEKIAWAIAKKIQNEGTSRFQTKDNMLDYIVETFPVILERITNNFFEDILK